MSLSNTLVIKLSIFELVHLGPQPFHVVLDSMLELAQRCIRGVILVCSHHLLAVLLEHAHDHGTMRSNIYFRYSCCEVLARATTSNHYQCFKMF